jgi:dolichol-phosphate mannosyltransferase
MDLSIVIPCYNEADSIEAMRDQLLPVLNELASDRSVELILVDDGSSDGTWTLLHDVFGTLDVQANIKLERHDQNRGVGAALRTGFSAATGKIVVTTDSDATYRFTEIPALLARLTPGVSIVTASPYHPAGGVQNVPGNRLVLSRGSSAIYQLLVDHRVHTYTSLFRAYRHEVIENVTFQSDGFLSGTELMVKAMLAGYRVAEYPTVLHARVRGTSKAKLVRTIRAHLRFQALVLCHRLRLRQISGTGVLSRT